MTVHSIRRTVPTRGKLAVRITNCGLRLPSVNALTTASGLPATCKRCAKAVPR